MGPAHKTQKVRVVFFVALCIACIALTVGYTLTTTGSSAGVRPVALPSLTEGTGVELLAGPPTPSAAEVASAVTPVTNVPPTVSARPQARTPIFLVRHTGLDQSYGALAAESGIDSSATRQATSMHCENVHFAGGRGVCLDARRGAITTYSAVLFDDRFQPTLTLSLSGIPSRTRVSPDGRYAATTVFVSGHSYAGTDFSTETQIFDSISGKPVVANLEQMEVWSKGSRLQSPDFNFWGVTFTSDRNRFYATLGTGGIAYLVEGDIAAHKVTVLKEGVECPSLSPNNTRVAFKKRVPGDGLAKWRLYVLDLATLTEAPVAESRFIDEQVEWLDDDHILYTQVDETARSKAVTNVWVVPADGSGEPAIVLREAASPTLARRAAEVARAY